MATKHTSKECPICEKAAQEEFAPFCSARCQKVDLNRWLSDRYSIPAVEQEPDLDELESDIPPQLRH
ncbi:DNA gyrase inhibitor YacG [Pseudovibrio exalbescens]|nr:DNA gyrase inhibitor YacG [Pseudovibrio exalbescens]MDD7911081.1 DNA gyrase inhibitor YacG [Pseudovibrio exalbescens]